MIIQTPLGSNASDSFPFVIEEKKFLERQRVGTTLSIRGPNSPALVQHFGAKRFWDTLLYLLIISRVSPV